MQRLRERKEWKLFAALAKADPALAGVWWVALVLRGLLPALFGIAMGVLVAAVQRGGGLAAPLTFAGIVFVLLQVLAPIHQAVSATLAYRLAVDPPAAKELRLFGLAGWVLDRFVRRRTQLHKLQYEATRLREKPLLWSLLLVIGANVLVFWSLAGAASAGEIALGALVIYAQSAVGASMIAFGGLNWALDGSSAPVAAVLRLESPMAAGGALPSGTHEAAGKPAREIRFRDVTFAYPSGGSAPVLQGFDLTIPAGSSLAIVGQNGAGKTTLAKLLCRLYDPQAGAIEIDGTDLREFALDSWRERVTAVFH